jgi:hypothetical protein
VIWFGATAQYGGWWLGGSELAGHAGTLLLWLLFDCGYCCLFAELYPMSIFETILGVSRWSFEWAECCGSGA